MSFNHLHTLNLSGNKIQVVTGLKSCVNLIEVNLSDNLIDKVSPNLWQLRPLKKLSNLDISENQISDADKVVPFLRNFAELVVLRAD